MPCLGSGQVPKATLVANNDAMADAWTEWHCPVCDEEFAMSAFGDMLALAERGAQMICPEHGVTIADSPWIADVLKEDQLDAILEELDALPR